MRKLTRMIAVGALAAAMLAGTAPASHALVGTGSDNHGDCVSAEVYTRDSSGNKDYIIGPKECLVPTPFPEGGSVWSHHPDLPVGFEVWFVLPPI